MNTASRDVAPTLEPHPILAALGYEDATNITRIHGGWETLLWRFETADGEQRSLRVYWVTDREESAQREVFALRHCEKVGFPAPRVLNVSQIAGLPVLVLSWIPGQTVLGEIESRPWRVRRLMRLMGRYHARLHALPTPSQDPSAPEAWVRRVEPGYEPVGDALLDLRLEHTSLLHLDYQPLNVLSDGTRLVGVIDWAGAAVGDVRADLARTHITLETTPIPPGPMHPVLVVLRLFVVRWWLSGYAAAAGSIPDYSPFRRWAAASLLREVSRVIDRPDVWAGPEYVTLLRNIAGGVRSARRGRA